MYIYTDMAHKFDNVCNLNFKCNTKFDEVTGDTLRNICSFKQMDLFHVL